MLRPENGNRDSERSRSQIENGLLFGLELVLIISECIKVSALHSLPSGSHFLGLTVEVNWKPYAVVVTFAFV